MSINTAPSSGSPEGAENKRLAAPMNVELELEQNHPLIVSLHRALEQGEDTLRRIGVFELHRDHDRGICVLKVRGDTRLLFVLGNILLGENAERGFSTEVAA